VDTTLDSVKPDRFDALVVPGDVANPDTLRVNKDAVAFVKSFLTSGKPVSAVCHSPLEAGRGGRCARQDGGVLAVAADRSAQRRRQVGR